MNKITNVTFGCDPEIFVRDANRLLSVVGRVGGTKEEPLQLIGLPKGFAVQEDNVAVEFCIPPASTADEFVKSVITALGSIEKDIAGQGLQFAFGVSSALFDEDQLQTQEAQTFGCDPDYNIYTLEENPRPNVGDQLGADGVRLRTAGGHVHFGWDNPEHDQRVAVGRAADLVLGTASVFLDPDARRMMLYGKAGAHRMKAYGIEYRTLSNFWLRSEQLMRFVAEEAQRVIDIANEFHEELLEDDVLTTMLERGINSRNRAVVTALRSRFKLPSEQSLAGLVVA